MFPNSLETKLCTSSKGGTIQRKRERNSLFALPSYIKTFPNMIQQPEVLVSPTGYGRCQCAPRSSPPLTRKELQASSRHQLNKGKGVNVFSRRHRKRPLIPRGYGLFYADGFLKSLQALLNASGSRGTTLQVHLIKEIPKLAALKDLPTTAFRDIVPLPSTTYRRLFLDSQAAFPLMHTL